MAESFGYVATGMALGVVFLGVVYYKLMRALKAPWYTPGTLAKRGVEKPKVEKLQDRKKG